jgi:hypothetical protein
MSQVRDSTEIGERCDALSELRLWLRVLSPRGDQLHQCAR